MWYQYVLLKHVKKTLFCLHFLLLFKKLEIATLHQENHSFFGKNAMEKFFKKLWSFLPYVNRLVHTSKKFKRVYVVGSNYIIILCTSIEIWKDFRTLRNYLTNFWDLIIISGYFVYPTLKWLNENIFRDWSCTLILADNQTKKTLV